MLSFIQVLCNRPIFRSNRPWDLSGKMTPYPKGVIFLDSYFGSGKWL